MGHAHYRPLVILRGCNLFLTISILFLFIIPQTIAPPPEPTLTLSPLEAVEHAVNLHNSGKSDAALTTLKIVAESAPELQEGWFYRGAVQQYTGDVLGALASYRALLSLNPSHVDALNNAGKAHSDLEDYGESLRYYNRALEVDPGHVQTLINVALTHHGKGDDDAAEASHLRALSACPTSVCYHADEVRRLGGGLERSDSLSYI